MSNPITGIHQTLHAARAWWEHTWPAIDLALAHALPWRRDQVATLRILSAYVDFWGELSPERSIGSAPWQENFRRLEQERWQSSVAHLGIKLQSVSPVQWRPDLVIRDPYRYADEEE